MTVQPLFNLCPRTVQKWVMSNIRQSDVKVLSKPCQTFVKLGNSWTDIGQVNPEIVTGWSNQVEKEQFFPLDKDWTGFGLPIFKFRVHILGF